MLLPIDSENYTPKFSGHETFPLRFGWLKKAYDALNDASANPFKEDKAIAKFGVGKNMINSIQHWAEAVDTVEVLSQRTKSGEVNKVIKNSELGVFLFDDDCGVDPFLENPDTIWLLHWKLCSRPTYTTWHWVFNFLNTREFTKDQILAHLSGLNGQYGWKKSVSSATMKRDIDCFVRTYCAKKIAKNEGNEDAIESALVELGLMSQGDTREKFRLNYGDKVSLSNQMLTYCVMDYWGRAEQEASKTISIGKLSFAPGSPGRAFLIDEDTLAGRLEKLSGNENPFFQWSETAGLKQLIRNRKFTKEDYEQILSSVYSS